MCLRLHFPRHFLRLQKTNWTAHLIEIQIENLVVHGFIHVTSCVRYLDTIVTVDRHSILHGYEEESEQTRCIWYYWRDVS